MDAIPPVDVIMAGMLLEGEGAVPDQAGSSGQAATSKSSGDGEVWIAMIQETLAKLPPKKMPQQMPMRKKVRAQPTKNQKSNHAPTAQQGTQPSSSQVISKLQRAVNQMLGKSEQAHKGNVLHQGQARTPTGDAVAKGFFSSGEAGGAHVRMPQLDANTDQMTGWLAGGQAGKEAMNGQERPRELANQEASFGHNARDVADNQADRWRPGRELSDGKLARELERAERSVEREKVRPKIIEETTTQLREAPRPQELRQPEKLHPDMFLGLGALSGSAHKLAGNPRFRSSRLVLLVSGEAERVVFNHLLKLHGRLHQQVFVWTLREGESFGEAWTFLGRLKMPHVTLTDFNLGTREGGWVKIKYLIRTLSIVPGRHKNILSHLRDEDIDALPDSDSSSVPMEPWIHLLERCGLFLSGPMNFDLLMFQTFPKVYGSLDKSLMPFDDACQWLLHKRPDEIEALGVHRTILERFCAVFSAEDRATVHRRALEELLSLDLVQELPEMLIRLVATIRRLVARSY